MEIGPLKIHPGRKQLAEQRRPSALAVRSTCSSKSDLRIQVRIEQYKGKKRRNTTGRIFVERTKRTDSVFNCLFALAAFHPRNLSITCHVAFST